MNVGQLREMLEDYDDDQPVRVATQPNWPLRLTVSTVKVNEPEMDADTEEAHMEALRSGNHALAASILAEHNGEPIVWLIAADHPSGDESPYAPRELFNAGW